MSMSQQGHSWGERPSKKKVTEQVAVATLDKFVNGGQQDMVRLNVEIPKTLRARVKARCALEGREIKDVVTELLEQRFPAL